MSGEKETLFFKTASAMTHIGVQHKKTTGSRQETRFGSHCVPREGTLDDRDHGMRAFEEPLAGRQVYQARNL
ncbi:MULTISPECIES: hypothetical protein [Burkholderia]|uniref:hypothetical protein n=1 Tax=Burkholderia TaxID=32008 RepID=UPI00158352DD|nr:MULTISPECIES: hypothetical protein [Burkholderia]MBN3776706.1 hypothetical protein [Burkholderia sp. Ac-20345]